MHISICLPYLNRADFWKFYSDVKANFWKLVWSISTFQVAIYRKFYKLTATPSVIQQCEFFSNIRYSEMTVILHCNRPRKCGEYFTVNVIIVIIIHTFMIIIMPKTIILLMSETGSH